MGPTVTLIHSTTNYATHMTPEQINCSHRQRVTYQALEITLDTIQTQKQFVGWRVYHLERQPFNGSSGDRDGPGRTSGPALHSPSQRAGGVSMARAPRHRPPCSGLLHWIYLSVRNLPSGLYKYGAHPHTKQCNRHAVLRCIQEQPSYLDSATPHATNGSFSLYTHTRTHVRWS
jgi:hypothetical protein